MIFKRLWKCKKCDCLNIDDIQSDRIVCENCGSIFSMGAIIMEQIGSYSFKEALDRNYGFRLEENEADNMDKIKE